MTDDTQKLRQQAKTAGSGAPATWSLEALETNLLAHMEARASDSAEIPLKRLRVQLELEPDYKEITAEWPEMDGPARLEAWKRLLACAERAQAAVLPICVQCGRCCETSSPTLKREDLELLREEKIPWEMLITLRRGEPAHNPFTKAAFYLPEERIKIREKQGSRECVFLDGATSQCRIYPDRPAQCRAQTCWDPQSAEQLSEMPDMVRRDLFAAAQMLMELIVEHDRRCSFDLLREAFEELQRSEGQSADQVVELLGFDDHYRNFVAEQLNLPPNTLDLVFGRSLASRVRLFGFKVETDPDGTHTLIPDTTQSK